MRIFSRHLALNLNTLFHSFYFTQSPQAAACSLHHQSSFLVRTNVVNSRALWLCRWSGTMTLREKWLVFWFKASEKTRHALSNAHYLHPTKSREAKRNAKHQAKKAATDKRVKKLEAGYGRDLKKRAPRKGSVNVTNNFHFSFEACFKCSAV